MTAENSTVESLATGRAGWARLTGLFSAARRRHAPGNGYFESGLMGREAFHL